MDTPHPTQTGPETSPPAAAPGNRLYFLVSVVAVFISVSYYSARHSPLPADNEPHYLVKAKHYWNPDWCAGDLFLESGNPHAVFYQTNGFLSLWLSLEQTTQIDRIIAHLLFAIGWVSLTAVLVPTRWAAILAIWLYLALHAYENLSGEWVIGGVEGKVYSYALILWGLSCWMRNHPFRFAICFGLAISFHPIVGIWATLAVIFAEISIRFRELKWKGLTPTKYDWQSGALLLLCALPGLFPAFHLLLTGTAKEKLIADYLLVYFRLAHHLDPMRFLNKGVTYYLVLSIPFLLSGLLLRRQPHWLKLWLFLLTAMLIALCGLAAGWGPRPAYEMPYYLTRMKILKFYPFRIYDACLPIMIALLMAAGIMKWQSMQSDKTVWLYRLLNGFLVAGAITFVTFLPTKSNYRYQPSVDGWIDICEWIREHTPADAVILSPQGNWAFKWYAQRQEFLSHKDVPQDAGSVVEWNRRIALLQELRRNGILYNEADIARLRAEGVTHLLVLARQPVDLPLRYRNDWYRLYEIE